MIVREKINSYILVKQHDHAYISGQLAENWNDDIFQKSKNRNDVIYSVYQHDRGWIALDHTPFWNDLSKKPYSFIDFPLVPKLVHYKHGIDEVERENSYAALLCSLHFCALLTSNDNEYQWFLSHEEDRQKKLKNDLKINPGWHQSLLHSHFDLLQFCDHLSLYLCMNKPGQQKSYQFKNSALLPFTKDMELTASWINTEQLSIAPFPFKDDFEIKIKYKEIFKQDVSKIGLVKAYHDADDQEFTFRIINSEKK
ncbi:DUF3891 family protein [Alkalihalobacillus sp. MEB130]|uniref:DUF3891 family protein n=1 Tax=Alkalihalobacillus sp. MEB130 TaxID=2976704 RepID=UPI0028DEEC33|nr:DUF3891 family protein [Alkalihalobacillus sp. MEB130]MDT8861222.1 DUF3891 family protein [Alkalihalobacillus sp. MEB130]